MRRVVVLALLALALPMAAWADNITLTNDFGSYTISSAGITVAHSQLRSFEDTSSSYNPPPNGALGTVSFSTGTLQSGSITSGAIFNGGGSFDVFGIGKWAKHLTGCGHCTNPVTIFTGSFSGPVTWTLTSQSGNSMTYQLVGAISGMLWNQRMATGTTTQNFFTYNHGTGNGNGAVRLGTANVGPSTPEPGTLGLLGTGIVGIAGMFRRKLMRG
ncbi:MAG: PEP-CTERM sorting domain-containing protein [Terriglobales bacterium]